MADFQSKSERKYVPCCPECGEPLQNIPKPIPKKGRGRCPNAGNYDFEIDVNHDEIIKDKDGNVKKATKWNISGVGKNKHNYD